MEHRSLRFGCVCASNQNRSMEAHDLFLKNGFDVKSYGTGSSVKLPGQSMHQPNVYGFNTPYQTMLEELEAQDKDLYVQNGVLRMLKRNSNIKRAPERFQETSEKFDVIITFEDRVFEAVLDHFNSKRSRTFEMTHVVNLEVNDTHAHAAIGAKYALEFAMVMSSLRNLEDEFEEALSRFADSSNSPMKFSIQYY
ncbi:hypothetical protein NDN08_001306 [Rhodosorus marinus]|uniref:RNA polymerase II subunit A C-terminal domain phosphatase SSU72 n=1 Tax=Rhodosorus marinus TaxID=101924 RepID=A0AAV8UQI3_9RHOD|nr:hypothetical protein NDN08_001306 [Rhodosorus marinus]